jgi:repressor LexA
LPESYTARQGQYLAFIHSYIVRRGYAPSFEDIARHFGTTTPSVNGMIKTLERRGLLERVPGVARSLRVCVPVAQLPQGDFGGPSKRVVASKRPESPVSPLAVTDAASVAAIAVLQLLAKLSEAEPPIPAEAAVMQCAKVVRLGLTKLGVGEKDAVEVERRIAAEAARYSESGRGIVVRRPPLWFRRLTGMR